MPPHQPLDSRATVVIIGCGPAGASCAIKLKKIASSQSLKPRFIVYEGKPLERKSHYNQCLGVLSPPLQRIMEGDLEIPFPWPIIQRKIEGYVLHTGQSVLTLSGEHAPSYACRRVEFDHYLYEKVRESGLEVIPARVTELDFLDDGVMVYSESNNIKADVVIGAFGLDEGMARIFERATPYRQPRFLSSVVTKIHPGEEAMARFGNYLHAFLPSSLPRVEFGAITPKGNHLSVNIAGRRVDAETMDAFLRLPEVQGVLSPLPGGSGQGLTYHKGKFPTLPARSPAGSRYLMIGDAAGFNRPFKGKGINSAVITGIEAAQALFSKGIGREASRDYLAACAELTADIPYGRALRALTLAFSRLGLLSGVLEAAGNEPALRKAMFNIVSGQETYRRTWQETRSFGLIVRTFLA
ncbi:MAG: NAD(P)/FAD-dependent oxidoreductase, partial [Candidatus Aminicenantes bacterium]|nr:NAD(P)/FAD-dependent oxidoreductase [Candidatus Aminicenantes bacterium]